MSLKLTSLNGHGALQASDTATHTQCCMFIELIKANECFTNLTVNVAFFKYPFLHQHPIQLQF